MICDELNRNGSKPVSQFDILHNGAVNHTLLFCASSVRCRSQWRVDWSTASSAIRVQSYTKRVEVVSRVGCTFFQITGLSVQIRKCSCGRTDLAKRVIDQRQVIISCLSR